jgi:hypothetical protein
LLKGDGVVADLLGDIDIDPEAGEGILGTKAHGLPPHQAETCRLAAKTNILSHRQVWDEVDLLIDGADAGGLRLSGRTWIDRLAVQQDLARVLAIDPGEHFDERAFAGAVLAH